MGRKGKGRKAHGRLRSIKHQTSTDGQTPPEWVININKCLDEGPDMDSGRSWTIYRIPKNMVSVHRPAYIPKIISIGPFYYQEPRLQAMEEHKMRYLLRVLGYTGLQHSVVDNRDNQGKQELAEPSSHSQQQRRRLSGKDIQLEKLEAAMKCLETKTRECYSEKFEDIESDDFVQMMVTDGCFVIELLRLFYKYYFEDDDKETICDPIFTTRWMIRSLQRDLLMLQNQLPFFVLQELFNLTSCPGKYNISLVDLTLKFFGPVIPRDDDSDIDRNMRLVLSNPNTEYDHLLDILRTSFITAIKVKKPIPKWKQPRQVTPSIRFVQEKQLSHSVRELQDAGVKFIKKNQSSLLDIKYENRELQIPPLYIDDNTVPVLLNFVAYEQCDEEAEPYFTNHLMFFDSLIDSSLDVDILHDCGIINHLLGSDKDVANLINTLCREIVYDVESCHLSKEMREVNGAYKAYYATRWHKWWANLLRDYFSSPWTFLSLLAAIVLLLLTSAQTFFAIYAYFKPPNSL